MENRKPYSSFVDLTGRKFGKLTVIKRVEDSVTRSGKKLVTWECKCDCGNICKVRSTNLKSGNSTSCGCNQGSVKRDTPNCNAGDYIGRKFGVLTIEKEIEPYRAPDGSKRRRFRCRCYCGNHKDERIDILQQGIVVSCGCLSARDLSKLKDFLDRK